MTILSETAVWLPAVFLKDYKAEFCYNLDFVWVFFPKKFMWILSSDNLATDVAEITKEIQRAVSSSRKRV